MGRILPMCVFVLFIYFAFTGHVQALIEHLLFLDAMNHLWTVPQEFSFYLVLPAFMVLCYGAYLLWRPLPVVLVAVSCIIFLWYPEVAMVQLYGNGDYKYPLFGWFFLGILLAGIHHIANSRGLKLTPRAALIVSLCGICLLLTMASLSTYVVTHWFGEYELLSLKYREWFGIGSALLIFIVLATPDSPLCRIFNWKPLRAIGVVSFSFYLHSRLQKVEGIHSLRFI